MLEGSSRSSGAAVEPGYALAEARRDKRVLRPLDSAPGERPEISGLRLAPWLLLRLSRALRSVVLRSVQFQFSVRLHLRFVRLRPR